MKLLICAIILLTIIVVNAGESISEETVIIPVPKSLEKSKIVLNKVDGSSTIFNSEEYMIVPRKHKKRTIKKEETKVVIVEKVVEKTVEKFNPNILSLKLVDSYGLPTSSVNGNVGRIKIERQLGLGLVYQRALTETLYFGAEVDTNSSIGLLLGKGF